jgi:hypothetical protein
MGFSDESTLFMAADGILHGKVLYRDLYVAYMPGGYYLYALFFKLFGTSVRVGRLLGVLLRCGNSLLIYHLARKAIPSGFAVLPAVALALLPGPWHKTLFVTLSLLDMVLVARYAERRSMGRLLLMGLATALTLLYRHWLGWVAMGSGLAVLLLPVLSVLRGEGSHRKRVLREAAKEVGAYVIVSLAPVLLVMYCFYLQNALSYMLNTVLFDALRGNLARRGNRLSSDYFIIPWVSGQDPLKFLSHYAMVALLPAQVLVFLWMGGVLLYRAVRRRGSAKDSVLLGILAFGVLVFGIVVLFPGPAHQFVSLPAGWVLGAYFLHGQYERLRARLEPRAWAKSTACVLVLVPMVLWISLVVSDVGGRYLSGSFAQRFRHSAWVDLPRAKVYYKHEAQARALTELVTCIEACIKPGDSLLTVLREELLHFLTGTFPYYRQRTIMRGMPSQQLLQLQHEVVETIEATRAECAVTTVADENVDDFTQPYILQYLQSAFEVECRQGQYKVLRRKE